MKIYTKKFNLVRISIILKKGVLIMEIKNNDIVVECEKCKDDKKNNKEFSRRFNVLLVVGIILTSVAPFSLIAWLVDYQMKISRLGDTIYIFNITYFLYITVCFIGMLTIKISKKPFSKVLMYCTMSLAIILTVMSFFIFLLPNYDSGYYIFSSNGFFIDGNFLSQGIIMFIISKLIKYGFYYQTTDDETI